MSEMFCFQCQQTAGGSGCVRTGVCGKQPETANLQDSLVCRLIRLAELCEEQNQHPKEVTRLLADGLFTTLTNVNFDNEAIRAFTERVEQQLHRMGGFAAGEDPGWLWQGETDTVSLHGFDPGNKTAERSPGAGVGCQTIPARRRRSGQMNIAARFERGSIPDDDLAVATLEIIQNGNSGTRIGKESPAERKNRIQAERTAAGRNTKRLNLFAHRTIRISNKNRHRMLSHRQNSRQQFA